jgi:hypothetical protein
MVKFLQRRWRWLALVILFSVCVSLKLNGSSVGMWSDILNEPQKPGLLLFAPQDVRTDEWQIWTPAALSQARQNPPFPIENLSIGGGRAPLIMNLPIAYYTTFFRPQLWGFFVFDFEHGFSFCWCCKIFGLFIGFVWLLQRLRVRSDLVIALGTLWMFFSNYVQWWFSSPVMLPEMIATWAICTGCMLEFFQQVGRRRVTLAFVLFVICGINFILCLYPPYQIPMLWLMPTIIVGSWLECRQAHEVWLGKRGLLITAAAILVVFLALLPFWLDARPTLEMVAHTYYPGGRRSSGGDLSLFQLFSGFVGFFQTKETIPKLYKNVCEASNFYPLWPAALFIAAVARVRRISPLSPLIVALGIFIIFLSAYCVLPLPKLLLNVTLLKLVTERRALLGIGILNILLCSVFIDRYQTKILRKPPALAAAIFWSCASTAIVWTANIGHPDVFPSRPQIILALVSNAAIVILFLLEKKRLWSLVILVILSIGTNVWVNPVMQGLAPLLRSQDFQKIDNLRAHDPSAKWIVYREFLVPELVLATGAQVLNGNKVLPDLDFLHRLDPNGGGDRIYDRYAYVYCELPKDLGKPTARLLSDMLYILYLPPDLPLLQEIGCRYLLFPDASAESELYGFARVYANERSGVFIYKRL